MITEYLPYAACLCGGAIFGFLTCAVLVQSRIAEGTEAIGRAADYVDDVEADLWIARHNEGVFRARIQTLTDIARSQQSIKSGRILDVLEG